MYRAFIKRILDIVLSLLAIVVLSPIFAILALMVRIKLGRPVLFRQIRPGKDGKLFCIYKFRSMADQKDDQGELRPDTERTSRFGSVLRSTSLDELPELVNILKGDMSLVGPRPLAVEYLPYYSEEERRRHDVRPGLTGLAQINGRNTLQWEQKFAYDIYYVDHLSFPLDVKIMLQTPLKVFRREDVVPFGEGIEEDFNVYRERQRRGENGAQ